MTTAFRPDTKLYIFDADGTLRRCTVPDQPCPHASDEWELLPNVIDVIEQLAERNLRVAIASNQGGVALGMLSHERARQLLSDLHAALYGGHDHPAPCEDLIEMCPHHPEAGKQLGPADPRVPVVPVDPAFVLAEPCACRKPAPGMLLALLWRFNLAPSDALFVGDRPEDEAAARAAGIPFEWAWDYFGWPTGRGAGWVLGAAGRLVVDPATGKHAIWPALNDPRSSGTP